MFVCRYSLLRVTPNTLLGNPRYNHQSQSSTGKISETESDSVMATWNISIWKCDCIPMVPWLHWGKAVFDEAQRATPVPKPCWIKSCLHQFTVLLWTQARLTVNRLYFLWKDLFNIGWRIVWVVKSNQVSNNNHFIYKAHSYTRQNQFVSRKNMQYNKIKQDFKECIKDI